MKGLSKFSYFRAFQRYGILKKNFFQQDLKLLLLLQKDKK